MFPFGITSGGLVHLVAAMKASPALAPGAIEGLSADDREKSGIVQEVAPPQTTWLST
jgi:hypothetical protein